MTSKKKINIKFDEATLLFIPQEETLLVLNTRAILDKNSLEYFPVDCTAELTVGNTKIDVEITISRLFYDSNDEKYSVEYVGRELIKVEQVIDVKSEIPEIVESMMKLKYEITLRGNDFSIHQVPIKLLFLIKQDELPRLLDTKSISVSLFGKEFYTSIESYAINKTNKENEIYAEISCSPLRQTMEEQGI